MKKKWMILAVLFVLTGCAAFSSAMAGTQDEAEPVSEQLMQIVGQKLAFTTTDPDGNSVTSEELFSPNEITMVNCWGIWCPYCMYELDELAQIHIGLQEKGCGIVGLEYEQDEEKYQQADATLKEYGVTYPNVVIPDEVRQYLVYFPTTFFVDREGTVIGTPIEGMAIDTYEKAVEELLSDRESDAAPGSTDSCEVLVTDEDGPVEGVMLQICDDATCSMLQTDGEGRGVFEASSGNAYEVHVLKVPEGYREDAKTYSISPDTPEVEIQLEKAG